MDAPVIGPVDPPDLHVMSYNLRRPLPWSRPGGPDRWAGRAPLVRRLLATERPTLLGVQEALPEQLTVALAGLGAGYRFVGTGRGRRGTGEHNAILFDAARLRLVGWRQRALSATPDVPGSRSWGSLLPRIVVSAAFDDAATGRRVVAFNTHLDPFSPRSRRESARRVARLAASVLERRPDALVVVTGDLNAGERSAARRELTAGHLRDTWEHGIRVTPRSRTYSGYRAPRRRGPRLDVVLVGGAAEVSRVAITTTRFDGAAPSDHEPVQAVVRSTA